MKMAKPTDHDINLALDIARIVEDLEQRREIYTRTTQHERWVAP